MTWRCDGSSDDPQLRGPFLQAEAQLTYFRTRPSAAGHDVNISNAFSNRRVREVMILRAATESSLNAPMSSPAEFQEKGSGSQSVTQSNGMAGRWEETPNGPHFNI